MVSYQFHASLLFILSSSYPFPLPSISKIQSSLHPKFPSPKISHLFQPFPSQTFLSPLKLPFPSSCSPLIFLPVTNISPLYCPFHFPLAVFDSSLIKVSSSTLHKTTTFPRLGHFPFSTKRKIPIPMAMVTTQPLSFDTDNHLRDTSFSSYLNSSEKTIISKLAENSNSLFLGRKKVGEGEGEIGVFRAEKYFNDLVVEENPRVSNNVTRIKTQYPKNAPIDISHLKSKIQPRTPSAYSESSWNSQSGLLQSVKRNPSQWKGKKRNGKNFISSLGCSCSCNVKNSIEINEKDEETNSKKSLGCGEFDGKMGKNEITQKGSDPVDLTRINQSGLNPWVMEEIHCKKIEEMGNGLNREDCFSFPILNSNPGGKSNPLNFQENQDEKQRNSLEVFGSSVLNKKNKNFLILEGNPAMWGWQADSVAEEFFDNSRYPGQLTNSGCPDKLTNSGCPGQLTHVVEEFGIPQSFDAMYNDNESEGSSDLFEIESFTNSGNSFLKRNGSDGMSTCVTPTTCYAPSEVSIEWSVVTASAAEFSSVISDSEEFVNSEGIRNPRKMGPDGKTSSVGGKEMENRRSGNLLSCKNYKAVRVAGDAYMRSGKGNFDSRRGHNKSSTEGKGK